MSESQQRRVTNRTLILRLVPLLTLLLVNVLFLAMLDSLFSNKKRAVIIDSKDRFEEFEQQLSRIKDPLLTIRNRYASDIDTYMDEARAFLDENVQSFLDADHPWFRVTLNDASNQEIASYENLAKKRRFNNFGNSLFSRSFEAPAAFPPIYITAYYATPVGWAAVESMVLRYWIYAILFVVSSTGIYLWLDRRVLLPLQRVGQSIETMTRPGQVALINSPLEDIEIACNRLARVQREVYFGMQVETIIDRFHSLSDHREVLENFMRAIADPIQQLYPVARVETHLVSEDPAPADSHPGTFLPEQKSWEEGTTIRVLEDGRVDLMLVPGEQPVGALRLHPDPDHPAREAPRVMAEEIQKQCSIGLARAMTRSRALTEERNRFGINLATNMGHDLTNIIATSKWDMNTIQRAVKAGIITLDEQRGAFFTDAVEGLRNNLFFLQEMVNIYRSFGYIRRPRFERIDCSEAVSETARLFRLSSSQKFNLETGITPGIQRTLEPRLFRMALFNLLSNSVQAVQRANQSAEQAIIHVSLSRNGTDTITLIVADNGPGIRDAEGNLLPPETIPRIFQSGYTTKDEATGGGLGLAWVKSIIEDYHQGTIEARNRSEGGACFTITLPELDLSEESASTTAQP